MRVALEPHPQHGTDAIDGIEADLSWAVRPGQPESRRWLLRYFVTGVVGRMRLPLSKKPARVENAQRPKRKTTQASAIAESATGSRAAQSCTPKIRKDAAVIQCFSGAFSR